MPPVSWVWRVIAALLGGILIADYWVIRRQQLSLPDLFKLDGVYAYSATSVLPTSSNRSFADTLIRKLDLTGSSVPGQL